MDINRMVGLQNNLTQSNYEGALSSGGALVGGAIGAAFGAPIAGAVIGQQVGRVAGSLLPQYTTVKGSTSGINFVPMGYKPYLIKVVRPTEREEKDISDNLCYWGCPSARTEALNIPTYMYEGHAFVKGDLHYNGTVPLNEFNEVAKIFARGVHFIQ